MSKNPNKKIVKSIQSALSISDSDVYKSEDGSYLILCKTQLDIRVIRVSPAGAVSEALLGKWHYWDSGKFK